MWHDVISGTARRSRHHLSCLTADAVLGSQPVFEMYFDFMDWRNPLLIDGAMYLGRHQNVESRGISIDLCCNVGALFLRSEWFTGFS